MRPVRVKRCIDTIAKRAEVKILLLHLVLRATSNCTRVERIGERQRKPGPFFVQRDREPRSWNYSLCV